MRPIVLAILDGYGIAPETVGNAIALTQKPTLDALMLRYPTVTLKASGDAVGLPYNEMGNSEVGHLTMGLGRVYDQSFLRITKAIWNKKFFSNPAFHSAREHLRKTGGAIHLLGLTSTGGVHSYIEHLYALIDFFFREGVRPIFVHAILDGRDTAFHSGRNFIARLEERLALFGLGSIASLSGRSWAMDKDNRWDRVKTAYRAIIEGESDEQFSSALRAIENSYNRGVYDEQFVPIALREQGSGAPVGPIRDGDAVIFFNFRSDRAREFTAALALPGFERFPRVRRKNLHVVTMTEYDKNLPVEVAFPPEPITTCLGSVLSEHGLRQLRVAETEKYAHITYFFNGHREDPYPLEDRILVPSPRVNSYDEEPEMSAEEVTSRVVSAIRAKAHDVIIVNFANVDMVAHTGSFEATERAVGVLDRCIGELVDAVRGVDGALLLTADHGNGEDMIDPITGMRTTIHSSNPVPLSLVHRLWYGRSGTSDLSLLDPIAGLSAIAPTVLELLGLPIPESMDGQRLASLLHLPLP